MMKTVDLGIEIPSFVRRATVGSIRGGSIDVRIV